ncbi:hypothetical protein D3C73_787310 [compost metagenome]
MESWEPDGTEVTFTWKVTVTLAPGVRVPIDIPVAGSAVGRDVPPTTTLPATKVLPAGIGSDRMTLVTAAMPLLLITEV